MTTPAETMRDTLRAAHVVRAVAREAAAAAYEAATTFGECMAAIHLDTDAYDAHMAVINAAVAKYAADTI